MWARIFLVASGCLFAVLMADILITKYQVAAGASDPTHLGDTGQFLVLLVSVTCFVVGALFKEKQAADGAAGNSRTNTSIPHREN